MKKHISTLFVYVLMILSVLPVLSQGTTNIHFPPDTPGKRAELYFKSFNDKDENEMRRYMEQNYTAVSLQERSIEERMARYRQIKHEIPALEPVKIVKQSEDEIKIIGHSSNQQWLELSFEYEKNDPFKITRLRVMILEEPPDLDAPTTSLSETEMLIEFESYINNLVGKDEFSGVILIAKNDKVIFRKAYGLASKEYNVANRIDTRFNLGSIDKFLTRIAIEQLAAAKRLSLDDPVGKHLPDYPDRSVAEKVTIRQLLDMTSGIGDFFGTKYEATPKNRIRSLADYLLLFGDNSLLFEPGTNRQYSNGGYIVLGLIIERVSGKTYFDYMQEHVYKMAGMDRTGHFEADIPVENIASGYTRNWDDADHSGEVHRNNMYTRPARGSSAGGGYSTVDDLHKLVLAVQAGQLSAPQTSESMKNGYIVIVLANYDPPAAGTIARKVNSYLERLK